jgi:hypothetical protein
MSWSRLSTSVIAVCALLPIFDGSARGDLVVNVYPSVAPNAFGSPSYPAYVANAIQALELGLTSNGTPGTPSYYQQIPLGATISTTEDIVTGFPSWLGLANPGAVFGSPFANELGNRLLYGLVIRGGGGDQFSISQLSFTASSSDPSNSLGFSFAAGSYNYGPDYVGVLYNGNPSDMSKWTLITSGPNTQLVDAVYGRGSGNAIAVYDNGVDSLQTQLTQAIAAIPSLTYTGTYSVTDVNSQTFTATATTNLLPTPEPATFVSAGVGVICVAFVCFRRRRVRTALTS